jgi:NAD(P)-dependent dehydrogenase (short-subunit alcohol dehydrogenase family)
MSGRDNRMAVRLEEKVAVVTGGSAGIGLAVAKELVAEGAYVFITGRRASELESAVKAVGDRSTAVQADASKPSDLDELYAKVKREKGRVDIVFANAGITEFAPLGKIEEAHLDRSFNTNVKGLVFTVQKALPLMPQGASVILNASMASAKGMEACSVYAATKAAVRSFARSWTMDLKDRRIRVNAISPGPIRTAGLGALAPPEQREFLFERLASAVPLGRLGEPEDIARAVAFLASDDASFVAGVEFFVDGGAAQV